MTAGTELSSHPAHLRPATSERTQRRRWRMLAAATYVVVAIGKLPGWRIERAGAALLGASPILFGVLWL